MASHSRFMFESPFSWELVWVRSKSAVKHCKKGSLAESIDIRILVIDEEKMLSFQQQFVPVRQCLSDCTVCLWCLYLLQMTLWRNSPEEENPRWSGTWICRQLLLVNLVSFFTLFFFIESKNEQDPLDLAARSKVNYQSFVCIRWTSYHASSRQYQKVFLVSNCVDHFIDCAIELTLIYWSPWGKKNDIRAMRSFNVSMIVLEQCARWADVTSCFETKIWTLCWISCLWCKSWTVCIVLFCVLNSCNFYELHQAGADFVTLWFRIPSSFALESFSNGNAVRVANRFGLFCNCLSPLHLM